MVIDAIVLAGGRASRLGGASKPALRYDGASLLQVAISAVSTARRIVVVGVAAEIEIAAPDADVLVSRERPAFAGPAAAIAEGLGRLADGDGPQSDFTAVVACDMPLVARAIDRLLAELRDASDGVVAVSSDGRIQHLAGIYSTGRLREAAANHRAAGDLEGLSVRALLSGLNPVSVPIDDASTDDVDTWSDADRLGVVAPHPLSS